MRIQYVGRRQLRPHQNDFGFWEPGEIKDIPNDVAEIMLFDEDDIFKPAPVPVAPKPKARRPRKKANDTTATGNSASTTA